MMWCRPRSMWPPRCCYTEQLLPALERLKQVLGERAAELAAMVKTGRTHLMDAMPITLAQELGAWRAQMPPARRAWQRRLPRLHALGARRYRGRHGHQCPSRSSARFSRGIWLTRTGIAFRAQRTIFSKRCRAQDTAVELSGQFKVLSVSLMKIANDLRWMNSGPLAGLAEIALPALQPGSSIMPGKVNPVVRRVGDHDRRAGHRQ